MKEMRIGSHKVTPQHQAAITLLGIAVGLILLIRWVCVPLVWRIHAQRTTVQELRAKLANARAAIATLPQEEAERQHVYTQYRAMVSHLTQDASVAQILERVSQLAKAHHLELTVVQAKPEETATHLVTVGPLLTLHEAPVTLQLTGRYRTIAEFLGGLSQEPWLSAVRTLTISKPNPASATLRADVTLAIYLVEEHPIP